MRMVPTTRAICFTCNRSCRATASASESTVRSSGLPAPVNVPPRDQSSGDSYSKSARSSVRCWV